VAKDNKANIMLAMQNMECMFPDEDKKMLLLQSYIQHECVWKLIMIYASLPNRYYSIDKKKKSKF
jgi:hypothetical protein